MRCDRKVTDLSKAELKSIESCLSKSGVAFLKHDEHFKAIVQADEAALKKHGIDLPTLIGKADSVLKAAHDSIRPYKSETHVMKMAGSFQYHDDRADNFQRMMRTVLESTSKRTPGVNVINCGAPADPAVWKGPNPFNVVPMNPEWACWSRMQAPVVIADRMYLVATITWGGAEQCPFQHPDDKKYHGYEYGSHDHVIISPGLNEDESIMLLSDLSLHMARAHGFCGGDNFYRIDPIKLANMLGCGPDVKPNPPGMVEACKKHLDLLKKNEPAEEEAESSEDAPLTQVKIEEKPEDKKPEALRKTLFDLAESGGLPPSAAEGSLNDIWDQIEASNLKNLKELTVGSVKAVVKEEAVHK